VLKYWYIILHSILLLWFTSGAKLYASNRILASPHPNVFKQPNAQGLIICNTKWMLLRRWVLKSKIYYFVQLWNCINLY